MRIDVAADRAMLEAATARPARRPWMQLLSAVLDLAGPNVELIRHSEKSWASATFSGSRHIIAVAFLSEDGLLAADRFIEALPEHEFRLSRHIVADATVIGCDQAMLPSPRTEVEAEFLLLDDI